MKNRTKWLTLTYICAGLLGLDAILTGRDAPAILAAGLIVSASISYRGGTE